VEYYRPEEGPPERKSSYTNVILIGCGVLFLLGAAAAFLLVHFFGVLRGPSKTVQRHLEAVQEKDYSLAYSYFTKGYRRNSSIHEFMNQLELFSGQLPYRSMKLKLVNTRNTKAEVDGTLTGQDGSIFAIHYELIREEGDWRIKTYRWESPGEQQRI
jgi:uncharacterized protein DUF4864